MAESTALLSDIDEIAPRNSGDNGQSHEKPASSHFKAVFKALALVTLIVSFLTIALLITNYIILRAAPLGNSNWYSLRRQSHELGKVIIASLVFAVINVVFNFPILLNVIVDIVLTACIIPRVVHLIEAFVGNSWCRAYRYGYPFPELDPRCDYWKLVVKVLMAVTAGLSLLICVIYLLQLVLRSVALHRSKFWKKPLAFTFPPGEVVVQFRLRVLRPEGGGQSVEARAETEHGPVYI